MWITLQLTGERIHINPAVLQQGGNSPLPSWSPTPSSSPSPLSHGHTPTITPTSSSNLLTSHVAANHTPSGSNHTPLVAQEGGHTPMGVFGADTPTFLQKRVWQEGVASGLESQPVSLTPDQFQVPVEMLNSLAAEGAGGAPSSSSSMGHVTPQGAMPLQESGGMGTRAGEGGKKKGVRRRNSSISGSPLGDQGECACMCGEVGAK